LANEDSDQESAANVRARANKTNTPEALALAGQIPIPVELQTDSRSWNLGLAKEQKTGAVARNSGAAQDATADDEPAKPPSATALHQGEVAFTVSFLKTAPTGVPATHGPSATSSSTAVPSAASALHVASQNGSQGGSQGKSSNKDQHSDPGTPADQVAAAVVHTSSTAPPEAQPVGTQNAITNTATVAPAVSTYAAGQSPAKPAPVQSSTPATEIAEPSQTPTARPQSLDFRVAGNDNQDVNVRVSQRAGDVQVTVRTGDTDLAQTLRQHLPELSDRLTQSGVQSEIWRPAAAAGAGSDNDASSSHQDDAQGYGGAAGENAGGQGQGNDQQQKAWLNELFSAEKGE
jgi:hypothetical protein